MKWQDYNELTISSIQKLSHKLINVDNDHYIQYHITENRTVQNLLRTNCLITGPGQDSLKLNRASSKSNIGPVEPMMISGHPEKRE